MTHEARRIAARADLVRVARLTGQPEGVAPSLTDYQRHGRYTTYRLAKLTATLRQHANIAWPDAVRKLGLVPCMEGGRIQPDDVLDDLRRVAVACGRPTVMPSQREYDAHGRYSSKSVYRVLGGPWREAAKRAGLTPKERSYRKADTRAAVLTRIRWYARKRGHEPGGVGPGVRELLVAGVVSSTVAYRLFGSGREMIEAAGFVARGPGGRAMVETDAGLRLAPVERERRAA